jgi:phosphatidylglycerol:prolipoprotein diacylglycerol transferase
MLGYIDFPSWLHPEIFPNTMIPIRWYGLMYVVAFGIAYMLIHWQLKQAKGSKLTAGESDDLSNLIFWGIAGLILGARILGTTLYDTDGYYLTHPWRIFWPFSPQGKFEGFQGMSYHGGVIGCTLGIIIYCRIKKKDTLLLGDYITAAIPLGYTFGRLGNFINGELFGRVTAAPWGMVFPAAERFSVKLPWVQEMASANKISLEGLDMVNLPRHPSQLYEAFGEGILLWLLLWFVARRWKPFKGFIIAMYIMGYGLIRFVIEYFREPDKGLDFPIMFGSAAGKPVTTQLFESLLNISTGQILCFLMILAGVILLFVFHRLSKMEEERKNREPVKGSSGSSRKLRKRIK